uniref:Uncharacterized protein n=1 Tax=Anguilla anguilla TaxID=7936 RepID=A0A0E9PNH0_ANGAN
MRKQRTYMHIILYIIHTCSPPLNT